MCVPRDRRQAGQLLHAQADGGARRELPRAEAHERLGNAAMPNEQPERAKEEYADACFTNFINSFFRRLRQLGAFGVFGSSMVSSLVEARRHPVTHTKP